MSDRRLKLEKSIPTHEEFSSSSTSSFSSDEETNAKVLKPIKDYLYNKRELTKQLFMSVKMEKIRMMLPQTLKKINVNELQEWCTSELSGMSKSRILSILNGKPMINSSDTNDSDDSGPSLEIISDTEAWITDSDQPVDQKDKSLISNKSKSKKNKKQSSNVNSNATKNKFSKSKGALNKNIDLNKVKNEKETENTNNQQGESLLDLLELEMRARAIRALIRKEEDVIPNTESNTTTPSTASTSIKQNISDTNRKELNTKALSETYKVLKESEVFQNLNSSLNEDEDVVLVIKPTPTIELLSSDSENENSRSCTSKSDNKVEQTNTVMSQGTELSDKEKNKNNLVNDDSDNKTLNKDQTDESNYQSTADVVKDQESGELSNEKNDNEAKTSVNILSETVDNNKNNNTPLSDDRLNDYEEVIDLDDYSSDMDDVDNDNNTNNIEKSNNLAENCSLNSTETWATRYYQTDNVQNVIKESKIQSEIRKRFRERQKLSKLSNSSKDSNKKSSTDEKTAELDEIKPMGSVEEYLALKNLPNSHDGSSTSSTNDDSKVIENPTDQVSEEKNNDPSTNSNLIVHEEQTLNTLFDKNS